MLTGPEALRSLNEALEEIRAEERTISKRLSRASEKVARLRETEATQLRALAEDRLGGERGKAVSGQLSRAEERAREMIEQHNADLAEAERRLGELGDRLKKLETRRRDENEKLAKAQDHLEEISRQVAEKLENDPAHEKRRAQIHKAYQVAERAMEKTGQAEADREEKGKPYRSDPLFMYLWERGFGTKNYRANNLVRALDGWVARLVDYHRARPNFAMLNDIPLRLREHAERLMAAAEAADDALDAVEIEAVDKAGGQQNHEAIEAAQVAIAEIDEEIVETEDEIDEVSRSQRQRAEGGDAAFQKALQIMAESLAHEDAATLLAQARATETGRDDTLVGRISETRTQITEDETEVREDRERLKVLAARRRELEDIEWEFKKQRFDDPRSRFDNQELVGDMLGEFLRGAITAATYWGAWRASQQWRDSTRRAGGRIGLPRDTFRGQVWRGGQHGGSSGISWGKLGGAIGEALSRPRSGSSGSSGSRRHRGFKTGGRF